jgi:DNA polymerase-1
VIYALDIETTGLDRFTDRILCIGLYSPTESFVFNTVADFAQWFESNPQVSYVTHGGSFDVKFLRHHGVDIVPRWANDTRSLASILIPGPGLAEGQKRELGLENLAIQLLGEKAYKLNRTDMTSYSQKEVEDYCLKDCETTYRLFDLFQKKYSDRTWFFVERWLMPATKFCAELEWNGVHIDEPGLKVYQAETQKRRDEVHEELQKLAERAIIFYHEQQVKAVSQTYREMYEKAKLKAKDQAKCLKRYADLESAAIQRLEPFNWNSSEQLKWLLKEYYQLDIRSDREDKETTNEAMLKTLDHPVAKKLVEYRELEKLCSTCIPALLENSKNSIVHASYNIGGTRTGRLSSSGPNLQQIPRGRIRSFITASSGRSLLTIDYSQIEVRIIAELAKEIELINAFREGIDAYSVIAQKLLKLDCDVREIKTKFKKERDTSKTAGLSILYGTGAAKLQEVLNKELNRRYTITECRQFIEEYRNSLPGVKALRKKLDQALANGKVYYNLLGRPFHIPSNDDIYMRGLNSLVQGSASDLVIYSQTSKVIPALNKLGVDFKHRMIIHDEVVIELRSDEAELLTNEVIIPAMTTEIQKELNFDVPLDVEAKISPVWEKP